MLLHLPDSRNVLASVVFPTAMMTSPISIDSSLFFLTYSRATWNAWSPNSFFSSFRNTVNKRKYSNIAGTVRRGIDFFKYLGKILTSQSSIQEETKSRLKSGTAWSQGLLEVRDCLKSGTPWNQDCLKSGTAWIRGLLEVGDCLKSGTAWSQGLLEVRDSLKSGTAWSQGLLEVRDCLKSGTAWSRGLL